VKYVNIVLVNIECGACVGICVGMNAYCTHARMTVHTIHAWHYINKSGLHSSRISFSIPP